MNNISVTRCTLTFQPGIPKWREESILILALRYLSSSSLVQVQLKRKWSPPACLSYIEISLQRSSPLHLSVFSLKGQTATATRRFAVLSTKK